MDWPKRSISRFSAVIKGASSAGAARRKGRRSDGPRRDTAAAISFKGLSEVRAAIAERATATTKKATDRAAASRDNSAAISSTPWRVCATETITGTGCAPASTTRSTAAMRIVSSE